MSPMGFYELSMGSYEPKQQSTTYERKRNIIARPPEPIDRKLREKAD